MLISKDKEILTTVFGEPSGVLFPFEYAWEIHQKFPGLIERMVHTHPHGATFLSEEDRTTLKAWTTTFYPSRIYMEVICPTNSGLFRKLFWYVLEGLEHWKKGGKKGERTMELLEAELSTERLRWEPPWVNQIIKYSYELKEK